MKHQSQLVLIKGLFSPVQRHFITEQQTWSHIHSLFCFCKQGWVQYACLENCLESLVGYRTKITANTSHGLRSGGKKKVFIDPIVNCVNVG